MAVRYLTDALTIPNAERTGAYLGSLNDVVDPIITCRAYAAWANWLIGNGKEARRLSDEAVTAARHRAHPFTLCLALSFDAWLCQLEDDAEATTRRAADVLESAEAHGFPFWVGWAKVLRAWGEARLGLPERVEQMRLGVDEWQAQRSKLGKTFFLGLIASVEASEGDLRDASRSIDQALEIAHRLGEHFWEPELLRIQAEIRRSLNVPEDEVDTLLDAAGRMATRQGATALADRIEGSRRR